MSSLFPPHIVESILFIPLFKNMVFQIESFGGLLILKDFSVSYAYTPVLYVVFARCKLVFLDQLHQRLRGVEILTSLLLSHKCTSDAVGPKAYWQSLHSIQVPSFCRLRSGPSSSHIYHTSSPSIINTSRPHLTWKWFMGIAFSFQIEVFLAILSSFGRFLGY